MAYLWLLLLIPPVAGAGWLARRWIKVSRTLREIDEAERRRVAENERRRRQTCSGSTKPAGER